MKPRFLILTIVTGMLLACGLALPAPGPDGTAPASAPAGASEASCPATMPATAPGLRSATMPAPMSAAISERRIAGLIAQLGAEEWKAREAATKELAVSLDAAEAVAEAYKHASDLEVRTRLESVLAAMAKRGVAAFRDVGWVGGWANEGDPNGTAWFRILSVEESPPGVRVRYDWQNGVMTLRLDGRRLAGAWRQDNAAGNIEFTLDAEGKFLSGQWNDSASNPPGWVKAFLR